MTVRLPYIDFAKTIGIALVVLGHVSGEGGSDAALFIRNLIYQFHVPLFFYLAGYCFKEQDSWRVFLIKKIKRLYFPFVTWNLIFFAVYLFAHRMNGDSIVLVDSVKHVIKIFCGIGITPLGGASWFLITLLQSLVIYKLLLTVLSKCKHPALWALGICLIIGIAGMLISLPGGTEKTMVALFFIAAGHMSRTNHLPDIIDKRLIVPFVVAGLVVLLLCSRVNRPDMTLHQYGFIPVFLLAALTGIFTTLLICSLLVRVRPLSFLGEWGQKTLWILLGHFAAFKLVTLVQMLSFGLPWSTIFTHPCNYVGKGWGVLYFLAGFFVPLFLSKINLQRIWARSRS